MEIINVPADGNCLFSALGIEVGIPSHQLRQEVVSFVTKNLQMKLNNGETVKYWMKVTGYICIHDYQNRMAKNGVYGEGFEIGMVSLMYNRRIAVWVPSPEDKLGIRKIEQYPGESPQINLLLSHEHYRLIRPKKK